MTDKTPITLIQGVVEYLDSNKLNSICSSSMGHKELQVALSWLELRQVKSPAFDLTLKQAQLIVDSFGGDGGDKDDPILMRISHETEAHSSSGLYLHNPEYPEEGYIFLEDLPDE